MSTEEEVSLSPKQIKMLGWLPKLGGLYKTTEPIKIHNSITDAKKWIAGIKTLSYTFESDRTIFITRVIPPCKREYPAIIEFMPNENEDRNENPNKDKIWTQVFLIYPPVNTSGYPIWQYFLKPVGEE